MKSVLIVSKWRNSAGVASVADRLRDRGLRSVLLSPYADDGNRVRCDDHMLVDWDREDPAAVIARLDQRGIVPIALVNWFEPLIPWQMALAGHYGFPGAGNALGLFLSKLLVRDYMRARGLSAIRFCGDPAEVDFFPAIVKPARESSGSWMVRRVDQPADLHQYQHDLAELGFADAELIIEEFVPGTEFSVDGPVLEGRFHPVLAVERPEHDDIRHHNAGIQISPPQQDHVQAGVRILTEMIDALCADLHIDQLWLHVEARVSETGRTELVEINPRPAGGLYSAIIRETTGIDQDDAFISMALGEFALEPGELNPAGGARFFGLFDLESGQLGRVEITTTADDLRALPGVIDALVFDGYRIDTLEKENFFVRFAFSGASVCELRSRMATVLNSIDYRLTPLPATH